MINLTRRSKRHVSVTSTAIRTRELAPAELGYNVKDAKDLASYHAMHGKVPTQAEIADMIARAKANLKDLNTYLPLSADGLMGRSVWGERG